MTQTDTIKETPPSPAKNTMAKKYPSPWEVLERRFAFAQAVRDKRRLTMTTPNDDAEIKALVAEIKTTKLPFFDTENPRQKLKELLGRRVGYLTDAEFESQFKASDCEKFGKFPHTWLHKPTASGAEGLTPAQKRMLAAGRSDAAIARKFSGHHRSLRFECVAVEFRAAVAA